MASTKPSLASLLEESRKLQGSVAASSDIPAVELGLEQIESASRRLGGGLQAPALGLGYGYASGSRMAVDGEQEGG